MSWIGNGRYDDVFVGCRAGPRAHVCDISNGRASGNVDGHNQISIPILESTHMIPVTAITSRIFSRNKDWSVGGGASAPASVPVQRVVRGDENGCAGGSRTTTRAKAAALIALGILGRHETCAQIIIIRVVGRHCDLRIGRVTSAPAAAISSKLERIIQRHCDLRTVSRIPSAPVVAAIISKELQRIFQRHVDLRIGSASVAVSTKLERIFQWYCDLRVGRVTSAPATLSNELQRIV
mmetsp:Transcript_17987/g.37516  ORF Transcript_17987/g.37516 Transcript_17987/m.37516 type:complete len:237 (-) Transcript_17987:1577-2287(-)